MQLGETQPLHRWDVSPQEAVAIQQRLRVRVQEAPPIALDSIRTIAGIDASYTGIARAAVVVFSFPDLTLLDSAVGTAPGGFPYVPGLLSFREAPAVLDAMTKLRISPDLLMFDGQGIAHPRRFGIASHLGVYLDKPSIGCAKSRLTGGYEEPGPSPGDMSPLTYRGETLGMALRTKPRTNPLFISIGYKIDLETAVRVVQDCLRGYRLPEPTRAAHNLATAAAHGEVHPGNQMSKDNQMSENEQSRLGQ
jgi:deoxyribonuclease V